MATFNTTIQLDEPAALVQHRVASALRSAASRSHIRAQPGLIVVTRRYTPGWAIVLGVIGLLVFLIGLLFFLVKNTDTLTIGISSRREGGCTVVVAGEASDEIIVAVQSALAVRPRHRPPAEPSRADEIEQLAALNKRGVLSDAEFQAAKTRLLGDAPRIESERPSAESD